MSLLDDLREAAGSLDQQYQPSSNEVPALLGALIAYTEHGDKLTKAAQDEDNPQAVNELVADDTGAESDPKAAEGSAKSSKGGK